MNATNRRIDKLSQRKQRCGFAHSRISALRTKPRRITRCALSSPSQDRHVYLGICCLFAFSPCIWFAFLLPLFTPGPQLSYFPNIRGHPHQKFDLPRSTDQRALVIPLQASDYYRGKRSITNDSFLHSLRKIIGGVFYERPSGQQTPTK